MPPKTKYSLIEIYETAFDYVRKSGMDKLSARMIARELGSSTMPIYSCGKSMWEIEEAVVKRAWNLLKMNQLKQRTNDPYLDIGLGYVMMAREDIHLFKCLHSEKHSELNQKLALDNFKSSLDLLEDYPLFHGAPEEMRIEILIQSLIYTHGFATLLTSPLGAGVEGLGSEEEITAKFMKASRMNRTGLEEMIRNQNLQNSPAKNISAQSSHETDMHFPSKEKP